MTTDFARHSGTPAKGGRTLNPDKTKARRMSGIRIAPRAAGMTGKNDRGDKPCAF